MLIKKLKINSIIIKTILFFSLSILNACVPIVFNAAGLATMSAYQSEKGIGLSISDTFLKTQVQETFFQTDVNKFRGVSVSVTDGSVLLTGKVKEPVTRIQSTKLSWSIRGVREVINEVIVSDGSSIRDAAKDLTAETSLKAKLISNKSVSASNYTVDVVNGTAFLSGVSKSKDEMDLVISISKSVKYINEIVNYLILSETLSQ